MNPMDMFKNFGQLQSKMQEAQARLKEISVTGSAGGGMVSITMNGEFQVLAVDIAREVIDPDDKSMVQDLIRAAHNDAVSKIREALQANVSSVVGDMPISPDMFGGGA